MFATPQKYSNYDHKIPISWTMVLIFILAGSPECPLSNEVWYYTQHKETVKWHQICWETSCFLTTQGLFCFCSAHWCSPGVCIPPSSFWSVTQSFLWAHQATIPHIKEEVNTFHMTPITEISIDEKVNFESQSPYYPIVPRNFHEFSRFWPPPLSSVQSLVLCSETSLSAPHKGMK